MIKHILIYINDHYHYDPRCDEIKQYYPFAYDITLSAVNNTEQYTEFKLTEDEMSYLAVHIVVALARNYSIEYQRHPHVLLVSEQGNSRLSANPDCSNMPYILERFFMVINKPMT
ncbi:PRD domain-containing protein [Orbus hercynius]|uniref:PRD domain-containing protein n=1 Tax=Orbus hercynius TaxID=593135 RepID=UPI0014753D72|nr:PRD domain-containing protein [Orbus hercynius]